MNDLPAGWTTCKAGFRHAPTSTCSHVVTLPGTGQHNNRTVPKHHDVVVMNAGNEVTRTYAKEGYYGHAETAKRRGANKLKYAPQWQKDLLERERLAAERRAASDLFA